MGLAMLGCKFSDEYFRNIILFDCCMLRPSPDLPTIEAELLRALYLAGALLESNYITPQKVVHIRPSHLKLIPFPTFSVWMAKDSSN